MWTIYGGASEDMIFVGFGMSKDRFIERLWEIIPESNCTQLEIRRLAGAYPYR